MRDGEIEEERRKHKPTPRWLQYPGEQLEEKKNGKEKDYKKIKYC